LKVNPVTGMVWALQNQDGNSTLSLINPRPAPSPLRFCMPCRRTSTERTAAAAAAMTTSGIDAHGLDFVAAPEPSTWAMLLVDF
jgi:hypothetical protein